MNINSMKESIDSLYKLLSNYISKDEFKKLEDLLKELQIKVEVNT